jgi:hypothetical protein
VVADGLVGAPLSYRQPYDGRSDERLAWAADILRALTDHGYAVISTVGPGDDLIPHAAAEVVDLTEDGGPPWTLAEVEHVVKWAGARGWEGIVWHHPDGRMAKLKVRDLR